VRHLETIKVRTNKQKQEYISFIYRVYRDDSNFRDLNLLFVKNFLWQKDTHAKRCIVQPMIIKDNNDIKAVGTFIYAQDMKELRLSFLEFLPSAQKYLEELLRQGKIIAQNHGLEKIVIGINGHISYGLGILVGKNNDFEFNANYNPFYYSVELDALNLTKKKAYSYIYSLTTSIFNKDIIDNVYNTYDFRSMSKQNFKNEMLLFGDLCDKVMCGTPYYSTKTKEEMYELMKQMKPLLKNEDIIFAMKDGKEVGFIFTHPDFADFMTKTRVNPVAVFLKNRFRKANKLIYNIIGVLPEYQKTALAFGLIHQTVNLCEGYKKVVSSFVLEENVQSTKACRIFSQGIEREYNLYELEV
jgi:hypothetical protein